MFWRNPKIMFFIGLYIGAKFLVGGAEVVDDIVLTLRDGVSQGFSLSGQGFDDFGDALD